jgi:uncharacterized protein
MTEILFGGRPPVDGYGPGFFRIAGQVREGPLLLLPSGVSPWMCPGDFAPVLAGAGHIDVLIVGMGAEIAHLPPSARTALEAAGLGVEAMSTPSACRTYNVLLAEGRRVAAALIPV